MKRMIKCFSLLLAVVAVFTMIPVTQTAALTFECDVEQYSDSLLMVNLDTDMEVFAKEADTKRYPAALTKVMTYIVAAEYFDDFDTEIPIKQSCIEAVVNGGMNCSGVDWYVNESLKVTDLLYALMLPVGHDAAMVFADYIGQGNLNTFVDMMNQKAEALGCTGTHFTNPFGNHDENHYTTARDLYKITRHAMGLPMFSKICATSTYYVKEDDDVPFITTNWLIDAARGGDYYYVYATGVKNGSTQEAGRCLIANAVYDGYAYMCICLHAPYDESKEENEQYCMVEAANMFRWAFLNLSFVTPVTKDTPVCEQKVDHAWDTDSILLVPQTDFNVILPQEYSEGDVRIVPDNTDPVSAPITKGDIVTTATVYYKDEAFTQINLVANESVGVSPILYTTDAIRGVLTSPWFLIAVGLVVILFIVYVSVSSSYAKKRKHDKSRKK
ncbi:D-alanyl-D-alanine carboxypeptidase family protein [Ruminococcus sp.]|uniref:D-alanyl-D-alanine carboxypeptidase family protein n=1 Tax=Ruminococcus sp. TaxID=41978 RepID=UPI003890DEB6